MASVVGRRWREMGKRITGSAVCLALLLGLLGCSQQASLTSKVDNALRGALTQTTNIEEVSPPEMIQQLRRSKSSQEPQVKIVGLKSDATIERTTATIQFDVENFSIFKDPELTLGPHLKVLLDDQPYTDVYDAKQSLTFTDLKPGTHKIQVFASTPWQESLKTPGAFDQLSFNVFAPTQANQAPLNQPLLIYSQPQGEYGTEPIMLDYILVPSSAQTQGSGSQLTSLTSSKVQVTVNGNSFITEEQPPIYLRGFKIGTNWVKVELLSASGTAIAHPLSETIQLVTLKPGGDDTLSKLIRGDLNAKDAEQIVSLGTSQHRAAQRLEDLSAPKPTPMPKAIEKQFEEKVNVSFPINPAPISIPSKTPVQQPAATVVPPRAERKVPISEQKPAEVQPEPTATPSPPANISKPTFLTKSAPEIDAPIQSFLKRFRQQDKSSLLSPAPDVTQPTKPVSEPAVPSIPEK
jgi:hypothetical protein